MSKNTVAASAQMRVVEPSSRKRTLALAASLCACLSAASAQSAPNNQALDEVFVTATRTPQPLSDVLADVSVIDRETIENSGATGIADVLARLPGIQIARNGGQGTATSVFIRGAESRYTAVYIDGVKVDSQSMGGATWEAIPLSLIERIEVVRGPSAAVYGSDAISGVVQIFTRKGEDGVHPFVSVGAGNKSSHDASAGISGKSGAWDYSVSGAYEKSKGFDATVSEQNFYGNPDRDGFTSRSAQAQLGFQINEVHRLDGTVLTSHLKSDYDNGPEQDSENKHRLTTGSLAWKSQWNAQLDTAFTVSDSTLRYETSPSPYMNKTSGRNYLFQTGYKLGIHQFSGILERREDKLTDLSGSRTKRHQNAVGVGYGLRTGQHSLQAHVRYDDDSAFGSRSTGSLAYGFNVTQKWRLTASASTAFRTPTLYQLFDAYSGNENLRPETARNAEVGVYFEDKAEKFSVVAYRNTVKNQITYQSIFDDQGFWMGGQYANVEKARYQGVTISASTFAAGTNWHVSLDFQDPKNVTTDKQLARRAKQYATLGADTLYAGWNLGAEMQTSAKRWDDSANTRRLGGYTVFNLYTSKKLNDDFTLTARIDNLGDKSYQTAYGYATAGRTFRVGLKWAPSLK